MSGELRIAFIGLMVYGGYKLATRKVPSQPTAPTHITAPPAAQTPQGQEAHPPGRVNMTAAGKSAGPPQVCAALLPITLPEPEPKGTEVHGGVA